MRDRSEIKVNLILNRLKGNKNCSASDRNIGKAYATQVLHK